MTIKEVLNQQRINFKKISSNPSLEVELILAHVLKKDRAFILANTDKILTKTQEKIAINFFKRRAKGEPLAYLRGYEDFYGLKFLVNKNVLIPRPETELIIEEILNNQQNKKNKTLIIDIGTGSGCIISTLAKNIKDKNTKFIALDISNSALTVAKKNAKNLKTDKKIKFIQSDLLSALLKKNNSRLYKLYGLLTLDSILITANLPYVTTGYLKKLTAKENISLKFEPNIALDGGKDGLKYYKKLSTELKQLKKLLPSAQITTLLEIEDDQAVKIKKIFPQTEIIKDYCSLNRLAIVK